MQIVPVIRVLFVDDNQDLCKLFQLFLESSKEFEVHTCTSAAQGLVYIANNPVDAIISDYAMPEMNGLDFLKYIKKDFPLIPFIILTGEDNKETAIEALNSGADFYQNKGEELDIQTRDIGNKIRLLVTQRESEASIRRKDAILEAISYAADQFLKGNLLHIDSRDILGRLGAATGADQVILYNVRDCTDTEVSSYEIPVSWPQASSEKRVSPTSWPARWLQELSRLRFFNGHLSSLPENEARIFNAVGAKSILALPIYANAILCGYLVFEDHTRELRRTPIEIQTLRMAAEIIGSARYRRHIEEFYKCPVEEAILGVFLLCGKKFRYVNPRICSIFGYRKEDLLKMDNPMAIIHPDDRDLFLKHVLMTFEGRNPSHHFECTGLRSDGKEIFLDIYMTSIKCQETRCVAGNLIDVTDRRQMQQSLQESEQRYRRLAEQIDDLIMVVDPSWKITYLNPAAQSAFPSVLPGHKEDLRELFVNERFSPFFTLINDSMTDGSIRSWSMELTLPSEKHAWFDISITPLKIDEGQVSSLVISFHDVSDRVHREEEIRKTGLAQLELNMEQFQILNDEIRNPIQVIKGLNQLQGGEYTKQIEAQLNIINDLIDKLDRAWVQSEKVHKFLLRHYQHGFFMDENTEENQ